MNLPVTISNIVTKQNGRGATLGYPTANLAYAGNLEDGVYTAIVSAVSPEIVNQPAIAFIGTAITFGDTERRLEVHLFDFEANLYEKEIHVTVLNFQRGNMKFASGEELIQQMKEDERIARKYFDLDLQA